MQPGGGARCAIIGSVVDSPTAEPMLMGDSDHRALAMLPFRHPVAERLLAEGTARREDGSTMAVGCFTPQAQLDYLYSLVRQLRPEVTVEVGMAHGLSTLAIAQALADNGGGRHLAIDPFQAVEYGRAGVVALREAGLAEWVEVVEAPSHHALPDLERQGLRAQFAYVDGNHQFDYVISDALCLDRILEVGGVLAFDDSDRPGVHEALRFVVLNRSYVSAYPDIVIEGYRYSPKLLRRLAQAAGRALPTVGRRLHPAVITPSDELGLKGRCAVLRKQADDDRDGQDTRLFRAF